MTSQPDMLNWGLLGNSLGFLLRLAQLEAFDAYFAKTEAAALPPGSLSILLMVRQNPGVRQGIVARALRVKRAHMTKIVHGMEQAGHIRGVIPNNDRRAVELHLTEAGLDAACRAWDAVRAHEAVPSNTLTEDETSTLCALLRKYLSLQEQGHEP